MKTILSQMLSNYATVTLEDQKHAIKEIVQEVALCGLSRAGFFKHAAFYGGTALRIFYNLDRFSEDLDFSLIAPNPEFELKPYFSSLEAEFAALGLQFSVEEKIKRADSTIKSAFLKGNTREHILNIYGGHNLTLNPDEKIKVKFEIDVQPPPGATYETKYRLLPSPYQVKLYDMPSLFAGKLHAVLCRAWKQRIKGRDLYDYLFYLSKQVRVNLPHLYARLKDSGIAISQETLTLNELACMLKERFETIDFEQAKMDILPFIKDPQVLELWNADFFMAITAQYLSSPNNP